MSSEAQVEMDWAGTDAAQGGAGAPAADAGASGAGSGAGSRSASGTSYLTDEEILGIEPVGSVAPTHGAVILSEAKNLSSIDHGGEDATKRDSSGKHGPQNDSVHGIDATAAMPEWIAAAATDPKNGAEAQALWREHQEFRAAFASPVEARAVAEEARAIKELLPGGVRDVISLREATQSVERIDAAIFSGDVRAQSEVVAEMARANPAAFRSMFAEAAKVLAGMGSRANEAGGRETGSPDAASANELAAGPTLHPSSGQALRKNGEGWGTQNQNQSQNQNLNPRQDGSRKESPVTDHPSQELRASQSPNTNYESQITNQPSQELSASDGLRFDPAAYAAFERATNDVVARDVRGSITGTLARVMPEGVADGAARRIGEDIFTEVHRALAADRALSEQVASVLRPPSPNGGYGGVRFGAEQQQRVAALVAGRAKQLVPSVARRVIGEWTSTVLNTARSKAARQAAAASRVDIAAPGGSLDSMPLRAMSAREVNYASMSDEEILGM